MYATINLGIRKVEKARLTDDCFAVLSSKAEKVTDMGKKEPTILYQQDSVS